MVGPADDAGLVLDDNQRVAEVTQFFEQQNQALGVTRMQSDARLVQHVKHVDEFRSKAGREVDPLRLTAGEGTGRTIQRKVTQANIDHRV